LPLGEARLAKLADQFQEWRELVEARREEAGHCPTCGMKGERIGDVHCDGHLLHQYQCPLGHIWGTRP
jgi:hypothetical protein